MWLIVFIPLAIYVIAAFSVNKNTLSKPDDYFAAFRKVSKTEFASSSIAYGFQVSTIFPFLLWGASMFLFVPFVNAIFWGVGIVLFYLSFNRISPYIGKSGTLHGFIGEAYGNEARTTASILTIAGFLGCIVAELWFGSRVLLSIFPNQDLLYMVLFLFVIFICIYLYKGGQISSIRTDQFQLAFIYIGVFGVFIYLLYLLIDSPSPIIAELNWGLVFLLLMTPIILNIRKYEFVKAHNLLDKILNYIIVLFLLLIIALALWIVLFKDGDISVKNFFNIEGFGVLGLLSFIILPCAWQFVDLTNWQRLLSVSGSDSEDINKNIKKGLLSYSIESPYTWMLFIILGLLISASYPDWTFKDILVDFPRHMIQSSKTIEQILGYTFIISVISIMISTIDSFIMAISFTYTYDLSKQFKAYQDNPQDTNLKQVLNSSKHFSYYLIFTALVLFVFFDKKTPLGGEGFIDLLLSFYSPALSFLPLILGILFLKKIPTKIWALSSMLIGSIIGISIGVYNVLSGDPTFQWLPVIASVASSSFIYLLGLCAKKKN